MRQNDAMRNNNRPFSENLITPTNKVKVYAPIDSELNVHKNGIEYRQSRNQSWGAYLRDLGHNRYTKLLRS